MHGREGENRKRSRHMWSVPSRATTVAGDSTATSITADSFCKDGRKISVGDCALFKSPQDFPPFIGIIRCLTLNKEKNLQLGVNWLYRPIEVKLGKGILPDFAPNEVFYSFHRDVIPAASLLHPCKVAFLPKGVELPLGVSSFVCRRVYDIRNKCLWWLTDQDYIDERQEEVDKLLRKTRIDMHATVQPGGRSPKQINGPTSASQLKPVSDNVQNATSFAPQSKGKKRERADQGSEPVKRERSSKTEDGESVQLKAEIILRSEISKITVKGGLVDLEGVQKLIQLMQPDIAERKMELNSRSILASVVAATEKFNCLSQFVLPKGLPILDEWLQDVHKGKIGDGSPKDGDKSVEEFLLVLLRALEKLPVNLEALKMCNIGKSVNHLRSHKNLEIQKKARSLVDTWKKRVEAEMNVIDAKSGSSQAVSWPSRSRLPEASHGGNRNGGGSSDIAVKNSVGQLSALKSASVKLVQGELTAKSTSSSPVSMKLPMSPASGKDVQARIVVGSISDIPSNTVREERSSSSSHSHNNSQSCSSDHAKATVFSGKEDARSSTAGSISANKMSGSSSRHRRSANGFPGPAVSGGQRETVSSRSSSLHRYSASEKLSHSGLTCEKALDVSVVEGNSQKLIVKIPNKGRSPARTGSGGSVDDPSTMNSRASSPVLVEKHDQSDCNSKGKSDANRPNTTSDVNTESWQSNDFKDVLTGSDEGDGSPDNVPQDELCRSGEDATKLGEVPRTASSSSGSKLKSGKAPEASFCSINALIESCVKCSEAKETISAGDDVGMNLLASVAAGEISKFDSVSPIGSPQSNTPAVEDPVKEDDDKLKSSNVNRIAQEQSQFSDCALADMDQGTVSVAATSDSRAESNYLSKQISADSCGEGKTASLISKQSPTGEGKDFNSSELDSQPSAETCVEINERSKGQREAAALIVTSVTVTEKVLDGGNSKHHEKAAIVTTTGVDSIQGTELRGGSSLLTGNKVNEVLSAMKVENAVVEGSSSHESLETDGENKRNTNGAFSSSDHLDEKPHSRKLQSEHLEASDDGSSKDMPSGSVDKLNTGKADEMDSKSQSSQPDKCKIDGRNNNASTDGQHVLSVPCSAVGDPKSGDLGARAESKEALEPNFVVAVAQKESPAFPLGEVDQLMRLRESKTTEIEATDRTKESFSVATNATDTRVSNVDTKLKFDLNEGFTVDDGKYGDIVNLVGPGNSASVSLVNPLPVPVSSVSSGLPASITVAAAAKRPFVPPDDLLKSKGELGWKGSAATSAFRPAEPRKVLEMPLGATNTPPDASTGKHGRMPLDIDLNVPDERILEDMDSRNSVVEAASTSDRITNCDLVQNDLMDYTSTHSSGGLHLDLNQVDETNDAGQPSTSFSHKLDVSLLPVKTSPCGLPNLVRRDFDLNNGPTLDELNAEPSSSSLHSRSKIQSQPPGAGPRINNEEMGTIASWFTNGNTYPAVTIPSILSDRREKPFPIVAAGGASRMLGPNVSGTPFNPDVYRGSVMSSSPAMPFPSTPFQYPVFSFGAPFPLSSSTFSGGSSTFMDSSPGGRLCFPAVNSQLFGSPATISPTPYPRPYAVRLPDGSNSIGLDTSRKWGRHGLDLNAGPGSLDVEGRDETSQLALRQLSIAGSHMLAEEQARMYQQVDDGILKRKDPEGGWDNESFRYKQSSWQ